MTMRTYFAALIVLILGCSSLLAQKPELSVQSGHAAAIVSLDFTSDGRVLASGSVDNTIKLWDTASGYQLRELRGHDMTVTALAFSPDDRLLASGSSDNTIKIWDYAKGVEKQTLKGHSLYVRSIAFSADGKVLASGSADGQVKLWELTSGRELRTLRPNVDPKNSMGIRVAFSGDNKTLVTAGEVVKLWDIRSSSEPRTIKVEEIVNRPDQPISIPDYAIAVSPDGKLLATGRKSVKLWEMATGKLVREIEGDAAELVFSTDGQSLAASQRTEIKIWNVNDGAVRSTWEASSLGLEAIAFHPHEKVIASGNVDHTITLWNATDGREVRVLKGHAASVMALSLSADGKVLASGLRGSLFTNDTVKIWEPATGQLVRSLTGQDDQAFSLGLTSDGKKLATKLPGGGVGLWDVTRDTQLRKFVAKTQRGSRFYLRRVAMSDDGRFVAGAGDDAVKVWDAETGSELFTLVGHRNGIWDMAFSHDGEMLVTGGADNLVKLWSIRTGAELKTLRLHAGGVGAVAFSPDDKRVVSGSHDRTIVMWDVATGEAAESFVGNQEWVNALAFSADGRNLASGAEDGSVRIWEVSTQRPLASLAGHTNRVNSVAFTPNGKLLISGSHDTSMKLWDVLSGKELASLFTLDKQDWLVLTPDGLFDGSPAAWNQILWRFSPNLFDVAPVELFFNEYYHPGLLADLYAGNRPVAPKNITQKDRRQPVLKIAVDEKQVAAAHPANRHISVKVEVDAAPAGAQDVRLFRNGALVKYWRGDVLQAKNRAVLETQIPIVAGANQLTAYAFNRDNVKSADATLTINGSERLKQPGTLHILAIAVNKYANSDFDLRFAVADAMDFANELQSQETKLKNFARTNIVSLHDSQATKANILKALNQLASTAKPEDAVIVYYAGHGTAQQNQFFLIPHDLGYRGPRNRVDEAGLATVLSHSISDRELERAFEGIDA